MVYSATGSFTQYLNIWMHYYTFIFFFIQTKALEYDITSYYVSPLQRLCCLSGNFQGALLYRGSIRHLNRVYREPSDPEAGLRWRSTHPVWVMKTEGQTEGKEPDLIRPRALSHDTEGPHTRINTHTHSCWDGWCDDCMTNMWTWKELNG